MDRTKVTWMRGIPASGKTTWACKLAENTGALRLNLDDLRAMFGQPWSKDHEKFVQRQQDKMGIDALKSGRSVIFDNTNLNPSQPRRFITLLWEAGLDPEFQVVDLRSVDVVECLHRNRKRIQDGTNNGVTDDVIHKMNGQASRKTANWTPEDIKATLPEIVPVPDDFIKGNPLAVICDLDGTLAIHQGRSPYDVAKCETDKVCWEVGDALELYHKDGCQIILCSGRSDEFRLQTESWLHQHRISYHHLFMRKAGDERRDSIIKLDLHDQYIRGKFNVCSVFDDRDRVVQIWRRLGYKTFQVDEGDF